MPPLTREEIAQMMEDNLRRISELVDARVEEALDRANVRDTITFQEFRRNYGVFNATNVKVLPRGSSIIIDTRSSANATGTVAKYVSLGDKYVEEWAKLVIP